MTPEEIRRIQEIQRLTQLPNFKPPLHLQHLQHIQKTLKMIQNLQRLQQTIKLIQESRVRHEEILKWAQTHREEFFDLSDQELEVVREQCEYDPEEWHILLRQLKKE